MSDSDLEITSIKFVTVYHSYSTFVCSKAVVTNFQESYDIPNSQGRSGLPCDIDADLW